jgi:hypothetical protein
VWLPSLDQNSVGCGSPSAWQPMKAVVFGCISIFCGMTVKTGGAEK